jgi:DNA mismatch repair protein MutS2
VRVLDLGLEAEIVSGPDEAGRVQLRRGSFAIQALANRLAPAATAPEPARPGGATLTPASETPAAEVHVRGMEADEALSAVDQALDQAVVAGLHELRIVHGVGRGVLRAAVERHLKGHPQVESQRLGGLGEGGRGVTVARLR